MDWANYSAFKPLNELLERASAKSLWKTQTNGILVEAFRTHNAGDLVVTIAENSWNVYKYISGNSYGQESFISCAEKGLANMTTHKYNSDGHLAEPEFERITTGTVLRMVSPDGGVSPFSDTVVIGISFLDKNGSGWSAANVQEALERVHEEWGPGNDFRVTIVLARPYLYSNSIGTCFNYLTGAEKHTCHPYNITSYRIVEMSTGEPASYQR